VFEWQVVHFEESEPHSCGTKTACRTSLWPELESKWKPTSCKYWNVALKPACLPLDSEPKPPLEPASRQNWNLTLKPAYLLLDSEPKPCCNLLLYTWWLMHRVCTKLLKKSWAGCITLVHTESPTSGYV